MAIPSPAYWYINYGDGSTTGYYAVPVWATATVYVVGNMVRPLTAPAVGNERLYICTTAGTSVTEPTWTFTKGALQSGTVEKFTECTGQPALNGSLTYTSGWTSGPGGVGTGVKNQAVALGYIIARDNGASYQICTTAGTAGNGAEPSFSNTAGTTTADNTVTWTSLGVVGNFTTAFSCPHARLSNARTNTWGAAGDIFFIGGNSAETRSTSVTLPSNSTITAPSFIYSVDQTKTSPGTGDISATPTASVSTTGNTAITFSAGYDFYQGVIFNNGSGANSVLPIIGSGAGYAFVFDTCQHNLVATGSGAVLAIGTTGSSAGKIEFRNTTVGIGAAGHTIKIAGQNFIWKNTPNALTGTAQTSVFSDTNTAAANMEVFGVDFSNAGANTIVAAGSLTNYRYTFTDCKVGASAVLVATTNTRGATADFIRCDNGATNYLDARFWYEGTQTQETTITRTGGATDGTQAISWKLVTTANSKWIYPFESQRIMLPWNGTTGSSMTVTVYGIWGGGAVPLNDDIWIEVQYPGSASTPQASFTSTTKANNLATGANTTTDASTWGGSTTAFKMVATFTPQMAGPIYVVVKAAKISTTFYIDPQPDISITTAAAKRAFIATGPLYINQTAGSGGAGMLVHPGMVGGMRG